MMKGFFGPYLLTFALSLCTNLGALDRTAFARAPTSDADSASGQYIEVDALNSGLPRLARMPDLETPQSSLENFILSCDAGGFDRAAYSLNLNDLPTEDQAELGAVLARQLKQVMDRQVWLSWDDVPDRPDGAIDEPSLKKEADGAEGPQLSIKLGRLYVGDRDFEVRLERVKPAGKRPVWVFSRQIVRHIPFLHRRFGPSRLERYVPDALKNHTIAKIQIWQWIGFAVFLAAGFALGRVAQAILDLAWKLDSPWVRTVAEALNGPGTMALGLWTFYFLARRSLGLAGPILSMIDPFYIAVLSLSLVWFLRRLIEFVSLRLSGRYSNLNSDNANALITRIEVIRHVVTFLVVIGGGIFVLTRFEWFRQVGVTLLASAGVAGVLLGIAAHRVLGNLFAGLMLAVTQPVKSGDAIIFEGEFGWVEEIAPTYLVIRIWDQRRLIVPILYLLDHPIQNWSRRSPRFLMPVMLYADYGIDVEGVRAELGRIMEQSPDWDRSVPPILQVTECKESTVELRALCSASDPTTSWNLRCFVRERLIAYIRNLESGRYLPRQRVALVEGSREPRRESDAQEASVTGHNGHGADRQH